MNFEEERIEPNKTALIQIRVLARVPVSARDEFPEAIDSIIEKIKTLFPQIKNKMDSPIIVTIKEMVE